jgi:hypothetical protein
MRVNHSDEPETDEIAWTLAARAAAELALWTPPDADTGVRRVAEAIHEVFVEPRDAA